MGDHSMDQGTKWQGQLGTQERTNVRRRPVFQDTCNHLPIQILFFTKEVILCSCLSLIHLGVGAFNKRKSLHQSVCHKSLHRQECVSEHFLGQVGVSLTITLFSSKAVSDKVEQMRSSWRGGRGVVLPKDNRREDS